MESRRGCVKLLPDGGTVVAVANTSTRELVCIDVSAQVRAASLPADFRRRGGQMFLTDLGSLHASMRTIYSTHKLRYFVIRNDQYHEHMKLTRTQIEDCCSWSLSRYMLHGLFC